MGMEGAEDKGETDLQRVVEAARIEARQRSDFVEAITEGIAMDTEASRGRGRGAVLRKERFECGEQCWFMVEWTEEMKSEFNLRVLIVDTHEGHRSQAVETMDPIRPVEIPSERERDARVLIGLREAT